MTMNRETLREYLHNPALVQILRQKLKVDQTRKDLRSALATIQAIYVSETTIAEVAQKLEEYNKISLNYGNLLEDLYGVIWQKEEIIEKYLDYEDYQIDQLPETIKIA